MMHQVIHQTVYRCVVAMLGLLLMAFVGGVLALFIVAPAHAQNVPAAAHRYRADLTRTAHSQWGLDAPVASFAAQLQQESGWQPGAISRVGASGMAQFMPATARWWCEINGLSATDCQPTNPTWALRALVGYDKWLYDRVAAVDGCNRMAFALSAYNGGLGWVQRDKALAKTNLLNPAIWFDQVERVNAGRSLANWRENRDYPQRILRRYERAYVAAGWGRGVCT